MLAQPFGRARPDDQPGNGGEAGLRHPLHAPLLCQFRRDAQEPGRLRTLSGPFTRRKVVCVRSKLDSQVARVHGAAIPLQPEAERAFPHAVFGQGIGSKIVPVVSHPVASFARGPGFPPAQTLLWVLSGSQSQRGEKAVDLMSTVFDFATSPLDVQRDGHCGRTGSGSSFGGLSTPVHSSGAWNNTRRSW